MPPLPRLQLVPVILGLALGGLPAAIAQIQTTPSSSAAPSPGTGQPSTSAPQYGTPAPASAADPLGIFAPSSPDGMGANAPFLPSAPGDPGSPGTLAPVPGRAAGSPTTGVGPRGAPPTAFGSVSDFSAEVGIRQLIDPNSPDLQPLSLGDFHLVRSETSGQSGRKSFDLGGRGAGRIGQTAGYRERFSRALASPTGALLPVSGSDQGRGGSRRDGARLAWPAIQSPCPDSAPPSGSTTTPACPG